MEKKYIRFIDSNYKTLFHVPDGGFIKVHSAWDGKDQVFPCKYIDEYHVQVGINCYHICQFAEFMERNNNTYEPVSEIGDLDFYQKKYFDRDNVDTSGSSIPYYCLIKDVTDKGTSAEVETEYAYCLAPASEDKIFCKFTWEKRSGSASKIFASDISQLCEDKKFCSRVNNIVSSIKAALERNHALSPYMKISIWQIDNKKDSDNLLFMNLNYLKKLKNMTDVVVNRSIYKKVYDGEVACADLEEVYTKFNINRPSDFRGHSLSVSDVIEVHESQNRTMPRVAPGFYFCDSFGFKSVPFVDTEERSLDDVIKDCDSLKTPADSSVKKEIDLQL